MKKLPQNPAHPFDKLPAAHRQHVERWLTSNSKRSDEVRWSLYPLGMVGRWIERAETAECARDHWKDQAEFWHKEFHKIVEIRKSLLGQLAEARAGAHDK